jgi:hypothetical protein
MAVEVKGVYSEQNLSHGAMAKPTLNRFGHLIAQHSFAATVERGRCFAVANQVGVAGAAGLSLTTPVLTLYNPAGSGVTGRLWYASAHCLIVNPAGGGPVVATVWLAAGTNTVGAAVTGTPTITHRNLKLGGIADAQGNKLVPLLAATLPAAPVAVDVLGVITTSTVLSTVTQGARMEKCYNGALLIQPGTNISIQTSTATETAALWCAYMWEECDLIV